MKQGEGPAPHCSQLVIKELIFMNEAENSSSCNIFDLSVQTDHLPTTVLRCPCGTLPTFCCDCLWTATLGMLLCDTLISLVYSA